MANAKEPLVRVEGLNIRFQGRDDDIYAVNGVDFTLAAGRVMVLLGESGSGKSVTLKALMRLHPPRRTRYQGLILYAGQNILELSEDALRKLRGSEMAMIFQEPMLAFDPVYSIGRQIAETIVRHEGISMKQARQRALELLQMVQIPMAASRLDNYPHELSGGMRQRAMIALALSCQPRLLLADEPTTALDATVQMQIIVLLRELQRELNMAVVFVTHDVGVAAEIADDVAVMYAGKLVEVGSVNTVFKHPSHPYTQGLLTSTVNEQAGKQRLETIPGTPPILHQAPRLCSFLPRCKFADDVCRNQAPPVIETEPGHQVRCLNPVF